VSSVVNGAAARAPRNGLGVDTQQTTRKYFNGATGEPWNWLSGEAIDASN
jgi:hypothetical protein